MIIYIATRLFCALYGFDWPLPENSRGFVATVSVLEFVAEFMFSFVWIVCWIKDRKEGGDHAD